MIGQTFIGKSFGGCVRYVLEKEGAKVLDQSGVCSDNAIDATKDFNMIREGNLNVKNAVWHSSISFAHQDNVDDVKMGEIAHDFIKSLGLDDSQYLVVRHTDTAHAHMHIIANRVRYDGTVVDDSFCKNRSARACDELERTYKLTIARNQSQGKEIVQDTIPIKKRMKEEVRKIVRKSLDGEVSEWNGLKRNLATAGIELRIQKQSTGRINGVSFKIEGLSLKGSAVDKSFSYARLNKQLETNRNRKLEEVRNKNEKMDNNRGRNHNRDESWGIGFG
jgi:hypothetical protein